MLQRITNQQIIFVPRVFENQVQIRAVILCYILSHAISTEMSHNICCSPLIYSYGPSVYGPSLVPQIRSSSNVTSSKDFIPSDPKKTPIRFSGPFPKYLAYLPCVPFYLSMYYLQPSLPSNSNPPNLGTLTKSH